MYYLKYYAEIQNFRGQFSRVEIHQAGTRPGQVLIIGDVCGLDLEIQGSQDDVFTPIVKTQAHLSMISSDDKPTEQGIKYGGWGEFFTPDATLYKMLIKTRATEQDPWTTRWTGYITPDSWQEDLGYRTPVTITARDNIGHLQDFEFDFDNYDKYGLASIRSILTAGMNLIELPMTLDMNSAPANFQAAGTDVLDAMVMCRHFEGKDWYSVIESLLDAIGYTLRYTDNNRVTLAPIRYLPNGGRGTGGDNRSNAVPVQFYDGNGVVVPAVKSIIEEHNYDYLGEVEIPIRSSDINYGTEGSYKAYVKWTNTRPGMEGKDAPVYSIVDGGSTNWLPGSDLYKTEDPSLLTLDREGESWDDYIFLAANGKRYSDAEGKRKQALQFTTRTPNVTLRAKFNSNPLSVLQDIVVPEDPEYEEEIKGGFVLENIGLYTFEFKVKYESNGETVYWDDTAGWVTEEVTNTRTFDPSSMTTDVEIQLESVSGMEGHGVMTFYFENIQYETSGISSLIVACHGVYARLSSFTIEPNTINLSKNTVKTNSDERYNVILRRNPEVSPLSRDVLFALPENYETGLFYYPSGSNFPEQYPYSGNWSNLNTSVTKPLPVIIHQQILAFRGGVLWELSGECAPIDGGILFANQLVRYKDRVYLITSGTIDFLGSGNLSGAALREYLDYDDIWDDTEEGDWSGDGEYNTVGGETASGSGHSGSSSGNGGSSNNFFELDGNGGVKLKDRYNGLSATGFITAGGGGSTSEEGGADLASVWLSLKTNEDQFANEKIHVAHIPSLPWSIIGSGKPTTIGGYGITDAYTKTQVDNLIGSINQFHYEIYPSTGSVTNPKSNVLYLIGPIGTGSDKYEEYVYPSAETGWVKIGETTIDLAPYLTIASAQATYQPIINDLATIRTRANEGHSAYEGLPTISDCLLSLQSQLDSVASRDNYDELTATAFYADTAAVSSLYAGAISLDGADLAGSLSSLSSRASILESRATSLEGRASILDGYFTNGSANSALRLTTVSKTAWGQTYWTSSGIPDSVSGNMSDVGNISMNGSISGATTITASGLIKTTNYMQAARFYLSDSVYFVLDANGVKLEGAGFYTDSFVTAGGVNSSGGGGGDVDLDRVWESLTNNIDFPNTKINQAHIPDMASTYGYLKGNQTITLTGVVTGRGATSITTSIADGALTIAKTNGLQAALNAKQDVIQDLETIRANAANGNTAYGWGATISDCLRSLQSQIDSIASRGPYDELSATYIYADVFAGSTAYFGTVYGVLSGTASNATNADNADKLDGVHANGLFTELTTSAGSTNLYITIGGTRLSKTVYAYYDSDGGVIASNMTTIGAALRSIQSQVDSVASRNCFEELAATSFFADMLSVGTNAVVGGAIDVKGAASVGSSLSVSSTANLYGALNVSGLATVAGGLKLTTTKKIWFDDTHYIELDSNGHLHTNAGFYSDSFITAGGVNATNS